MNENGPKPPSEPTELIVTSAIGEGGRKTLKMVLLIASFGMLAFIVITMTFSFREPVFDALFPKPASKAAALPSVNPTSAPVSTPVAASGVKRIFLSSEMFDGNLGGLSGADQKCQSLAEKASLGGSWKAWLSDSKTSADSRLTKSGGQYKLVDGKVVADNWSDLADGVLKGAVNLTEEKQIDSWNIWTNTTGTGSAISGDDCQSWTSNDGNLAARVGSSSFADQRWSSYGTSSCNYSRKLYCLEQ